MNTETLTKPASRRGFLLGVTAAGAGVAAASSLSSLGPLAALAKSSGSNAMTKSDTDILVAASIAEALAVTTYTNIINRSSFFKRLPVPDKKYLTAARQEEMAHYDLERA
ncbi:MAG TPA: hypothetical protein VG815_13220 [Chloroflexota bacterium]|jgi:hypothetical protein|nr:hypothetical protein [Chloroflexota bacterium]